MQCTLSHAFPTHKVIIRAIAPTRPPIAFQRSSSIIRIVLPNVRLQARTACGTRVQSALIWTFAVQASHTACEQRACEEVCDEQQQRHVKRVRELNAGRAAERV
jgi:hypothetical protein